LYFLISRFSHGSSALVVLGPLYEVSVQQSDTPHSVGLLWTCNRLVATHNSHKRQTSMCPAGVRTHNPRKRAFIQPIWDRASTGMDHLH